MTDRVKAIMMAYARVCTITGDEIPIFQKYIEDIAGRSISIDTIKNIIDIMKKNLTDAYKAEVSNND